MDLPTFYSENDQYWDRNKPKIREKRDKRPKIKVSDYATMKLEEYSKALRLTSVIIKDALDILATLLYQQRMLEKPTVHSHVAVFIFIACRRARFTMNLAHIVDTINTIELSELSLLNVLNAIWFVEYELKYNWYPGGGNLTAHGFHITPVSSDSANAFLIDGEKKEFRLSFTTCESLRCCCNHVGDVTLDSTYASTNPCFMDLRATLPYVKPVIPEEFEYDDEQPDASYYALLLGKDWNPPGHDESAPPGSPPPMYPPRWEIDEKTATEWDKCDRRRFYPPEHMTEHIDNYLQGHYNYGLTRNCISYEKN